FLGRIQDPPSAKTRPIDDSAFRAIMFTDMVGSTEMTAQLGDTMAVELLRAHDAIIRRCLEHHRGSEVKHLGDGIMASFVDVPASGAAAVEPVIAPKKRLCLNVRQKRLLVSPFGKKALRYQRTAQSVLNQSRQPGLSYAFPLIASFLRRPPARLR